MVGCSPEAGCQALKRTPATTSPVRPVPVIGMRRPLQVTMCRPCDEAGGLDLQALDRGIDIAHRAADAALFAEHMPGLERLPELDVHTRRARSSRRPGSGIPAAPRTSPARTDSRRGRGRRDPEEVLPDEMRQHEAVVQRRPPADAVAELRIAPEPGDQRAQEQLLRKTHARIGRHLEGAELDQAEAARRRRRENRAYRCRFRPGACCR